MPTAQQTLVSPAKLQASVKVQESQRKINEFLRRADTLLKQGNGDEALHLIREARALDPKHPYSEAMEERILRWKAERQQPGHVAPTVTSPPTSTPAPPTASAPPSPALKVSAQQAPMKKEAHPTNTGARVVPPMRPGRSGRDVVLVIDDDDLFRTALEESIAQGGYETIGLATGEEALTLLHRLTPDAIICDVNLKTPGMGGFTLYERITTMEHMHGVPFMFLTGLHDEVLLRTAKELGADDYLRKPISEADLLSAIRGKIRRYRRLSEIAARTETCTAA